MIDLWIPPANVFDWEPDHVWIIGVFSPRVVRDDRIDMYWRGGRR